MLLLLRMVMATSHAISSLHGLASHAHLGMQKLQSGLTLSVVDGKSALNLTSHLAGLEAFSQKGRGSAGGRMLQDAEVPACDWNEDWEDCNINPTFLQTAGMTGAFQDLYESVTHDERCRQFVTKFECQANKDQRCKWV